MAPILRVSIFHQRSHRKWTVVRKPLDERNRVTRIVFRSLVGFAAWAWPCTGAAQESPPVEHLLPAGEHSVDVLQLVPHPELASLGFRMQAAAQANSTRFEEHFASAGPGEPMTYHPNLGVTEEEYARVLVLADSSSMAVSATVPMTMFEAGSGVSITSPDIPALQEFSVASDGGPVTTQQGQLDYLEEVHVDGTGGVLGAWDGHKWRRFEGDADSGTFLEETMSIGRVRDGGCTLISYRFRRTVAGRLVARDHHDLLLTVESGVSCGP